MKHVIWNRRQAAVWSVFVMILVAVSSLVRAAQPEGLLSKKELKLLVTSAKTAEDHQRLARHFAVKADRLEAESEEHERLAADYRRIRGENPFEMKAPMSPRTVAHCEYFTEKTHEASQEARTLAAAHEDMARRAE